MKQPVALFAFRRPEHTSRVMQAIRNYRPETLYLIADGPRYDRPLDESLCMETRKVLEQVDWECDVQRVYADVNLGLKKRVSTGLDFVFQRESSAIILEDDCLPNEDFFSFCEFALGKHSEDTQVALVSGNNFNPKPGESDQYFFTTHANIWGWATWQRTWLSFRESQYLDQLSDEEQVRVLSSVPLRRVRRNFAKLLHRLPKLDSWAIPFAAYVYRQNWLCITPGANLVTNVGMGAESTHTKFESYVDEIPLGRLEWPLRTPVSIGPDLKRMKREERSRAVRWILHPILHPVDFLGRALRYAITLLNRGR